MMGVLVVLQIPLTYTVNLIFETPVSLKSIDGDTRENDE